MWWLIMKIESLIISTLLLGIAGFIGYKWDQKIKLEEYFIEQFALDWLKQVTRGEKNAHGEIFEKAEQEMKKMGYNPLEIQEIMIKGFDRGNSIIAAQSQSPTQQS